MITDSDMSMDEAIVKEKFPMALIARGFCSSCDAYHFKVMSCSEVQEAQPLSGEADTSKEAWQIAAANCNPHYISGIEHHVTHRH